MLGVGERAEVERKWGHDIHFLSSFRGRELLAVHAAQGTKKMWPPVVRPEGVEAEMWTPELGCKSSNPFLPFPSSAVPGKLLSLSCLVPHL